MVIDKVYKLYNWKKSHWL